MAFIPVNNCVQARLQWQSNGGTIAENIFYAATSSAPTPADLSAVGDLFGTWLEESWRIGHNAFWKAIGVSLRAMNEEEGLAVNFTDGFPYVGTLTSVPEPNQVCYTVTWSSGLVGRSARGRSYGVGLSAGQTENGNRLNDASQLDLQVRWGNLLTVFSTGGHALQIVSFVEAGVPRTAGRMLPILSSNVRFPLATQRRRLT